MLIQSKGILIRNFYLPLFELYQGELLGLFLQNGQHFYELEQRIISLLSGKEQKSNLTVEQPFAFVERIKTPYWKKLFFPLTVQQYLKKKWKIR